MKEVNLLIDIKPALIKELKNLKIDLSLFWGLSLAIKKDNKFIAFDWITKSLVRKGWIDDNYNITVYGKDIYNQLLLVNKKNKEINIKKTIMDKFQKDLTDFENWWNVYPSTDHFIYNSVEYKGTQAKKIKKDECSDLFILLNAKYSFDDIIKATQYHIETAKKQSIKTNKNQISFIPNSLRYLREEVFQPFIEISKNEIHNSSSYKEIELGL